MQGYFLVSPDRPLIEAHVRQVNRWQQLEYRGLASTLLMPPENLAMPLADVYQDIDFTQSER